MKDHRYPEEVKDDYRRRITLREHPEIRQMVRQYGRLAVIGAGVVISYKTEAERDEEESNDEIRRQVHTSIIQT